MNQMMVQWGERAREYNTLAGATEGIVKKSKDLRLQVEDAQKHCLVQSNKLNESQERLRQAHELLDESNRTSLAKDDILNRLDQAAFSIAASSAIFEHAAENFIPLQSFDLVMDARRYSRMGTSNARRWKRDYNS
jgi:hypothetical protein